MSCFISCSDSIAIPVELYSKTKASQAVAFNSLGNVLMSNAFSEHLTTIQRDLRVLIPGSRQVRWSHGCGDGMVEAMDLGHTWPGLAPTKSHKQGKMVRVQPLLGSPWEIQMPPLANPLTRRTGWTAHLGVPTRSPCPVVPHPPG